MDIQREARDVHTPKKDHRRVQWKGVAVCKPKREVSRETRPAAVLILNFGPLEL